MAKKQKPSNLFEKAEQLIESGEKRKTMNAKQEELVSNYVELCRKLGKIASKREVERFIGYKYEAIFTKFSELKDLAISEYPDLEKMQAPVKVNAADVEQYRLGLQAAKTKQSNRKELSTASTLDYISQFAERTFGGKIKPISYKNKKHKDSSRSLVLTLSDLHFGANIKAEETGNTDYNKVEESRRFARIIEETIGYKPQYRDVTDLHVNLLGDIIQHKLHDVQDAAPMAEQICRAIHLLTQGFAQLAENFQKVTVHCCVGNHGRDLNRHRERATSSKWDSIETVIYYAVKTALNSYKNLEFDIPKTPFVIYKVQGHRAFASHGDNVFKVGNPGKNILVGNLEDQVNRINASLPDKEEVKLVFAGHCHRGSVSVLNNGANFITNGPLLPVDQFCISIGIFEGQCSQTLVEVTPEFCLGDIRFIKVNENEDKNSELDKLIQPWDSL